MRMLKLKTGSNTGSDTLTRDPTLPKSLTRKPSSHGVYVHQCLEKIPDIFSREVSKHRPILIFFWHKYL